MGVVRFEGVSPLECKEFMSNFRTGNVKLCYTFSDVTLIFVARISLAM